LRRRQPSVRVAFDVTLTTEKSFSVAALLADPQKGFEVLAAIQAANEAALGWLEKNAAVARVVREVVGAEGLTIASFRHLTSRALDPFVHHHNVIANSVEVDGVGHRALDGRELFNNAKAAGALATVEARCHMTTSLGVRWRRGQRGSWEVAGIPDEVLREFSQRRNEVDEAVKELEQEIGRGATPDDVDHVARATRPDKEYVDVKRIRDQWWQRARSLGFTEPDLDNCFDQPAPHPPSSRDWLFAKLASPGMGVCRDRSICDLGDVLSTLADLPIPQPDDSEPQPMVVPADELAAIAVAFLTSDHVVQLRGGRHALFTTREILAVQERIVGRFQRGLRVRTMGVVPDSVLQEALDANPILNAEQRQLVEAFCGSGYSVQCAVGHAGAGKTTAMAAAHAAWKVAGWSVVGAAVKGEAARLLANQTGMTTETLAWWLAHDDPQNVPLDAQTVLVVGEASTISDRDLDKLTWLCAETGTVLRLIGDPAQHGAVEAGGMFRVLCELHPAETPSLETTHRARDPHDRAAAEALRRGAVDEALDHLSLGRHLHIVEDAVDFYRHALTRWWEAHRTGLHHPMVDGRNAVRRRLNRLAHRLLQAAGEVGIEELQASGDRGFAVGDRVIARVPARDLHPPGRPKNYIRNGSRGVVTAIGRGLRPQADTITVAFDGIGTVLLPRWYFDTHDRTGGPADVVGLDHAYAVTSYAVQGSTSEISTSRIDDRSTRAELLVDITRGRHANHVYLTRSSDDLAGEQLPRVEAPPVDDAVAHRLQRSKGEKTAWELAHRMDIPHQEEPLTSAYIGL
jgi:conjugative relaxase-like TrwC/TraI family protein